MSANSTSWFQGKIKPPLTAVGIGGVGTREQPHPVTHSEWQRIRDTALIAGIENHLVRPDFADDPATLADCCAFTARRGAQSAATCTTASR